MPFMSSSPVDYPPTSSPTEGSPRKKRRTTPSREPFADMSANGRSTTIAGFLDEDSEEENQLPSIGAVLLKERRHESSQSTAIGHTSIPLAEINNLQAGSPTFGIREQSSREGQEPHLRERRAITKKPLTIRSSTGKSRYLGERRATPGRSYEQVIADRSVAVVGRARTSYYGINIHELFDQEAEESQKRNEKTGAEHAQRSIERPLSANGKPSKTLMWTEKYRARKFTDLVGDERTHRSVLRWLKAWDSIVFPGLVKPKTNTGNIREGNGDDHAHRKVLLLTGPPGLGKTTLAHVCARQAGYEVSEINASDERSKHVVKDRIQTMTGTENVRIAGNRTNSARTERSARPLCVVVDEVDGVVSGNSGNSGEGGFIKALIDLVILDQKNSQRTSTTSASALPRKKRKGDDFRLQRPLILICNDVYHPSLRPLRQSGIAEIIHVRRPALNMIISRTQAVFEKEAIPCDGDAVRRLCEATWGVSSRKDGASSSGIGEGDIRGIMVVSEWVAAKFRTSCKPSNAQTQRLTRSWIEQNILNDLSFGGGAARSLGRGSSKEIVDRIFLEGAGFPKTATSVGPKASVQGSSAPIGVAEGAKRQVVERLSHMIDTHGDCDKVVADCFSSYATIPFQDDNFLTKPTAIYDWLHFHDSLSRAVYTSQDWELQPYLSSSILAFHHLFASPTRHSAWGNSNKMNSKDHEDAAVEDEASHPFAGPGASFAVNEAQRRSTELLSSIQDSLMTSMARLFCADDLVATELAPYFCRMVAPNITPVVVGGSDKSTSTASVRRAGEKECVARAVNAMQATGVRFERSRLDFDDVGPAGRANGGWIFRMEPAMDVLAGFETGGKGFGAEKGMGVRYAVRQVLDSEWKKEEKRAEEDRKKRRWAAGGAEGEGKTSDVKRQERGGIGMKEPEKERKAQGLKRDFFGRVITEPRPKTPGESDNMHSKPSKRQKHECPGVDENRIWVSFHEGYSNAVRKPITIEELMRGL